jgi:hypothetical protein
MAGETDSLSRDRAWQKKSRNELFRWLPGCAGLAVAGPGGVVVPGRVGVGGGVGAEWGGIGHQVVAELIGCRSARELFIIRDVERIRVGRERRGRRDFPRGELIKPRAEKPREGQGGDEEHRGRDRAIADALAALFEAGAHDHAAREIIRQLWCGRR